MGEPPKIEITANLIHWQVEQNEKIAISSIDKTSVFSAQDIAENKARKIEKEKKKTEELFKMEEKKKEREKAAATQIPLVWDGAEWVFEDEHAKRKEEARIAREEAALAEAERKRLAKEESSEDEDGTPRPPKKKVTDIFTERAEKKKPEQQKSAIIPKDLSKMKGK